MLLKDGRPLANAGILASLFVVFTACGKDSPKSGARADTAAPSKVATAPTAAKRDTAPPAPGSLREGRSAMDQRSFVAAYRAGDASVAKWPAIESAPGALLPAKRIVAFYGNPHSKKMGVIGEYAEAEMLGMWDRTVQEWKTADPSTPVVPAIHLVTVVAQGAPGADGMWRRREDASMIEKTYAWAKSRNGVLFLDIQASHSTLQQELPALLPYLERPDVHLGVDPEFYMHYDKEGARPSSRIGTMMASDVNYVIRTLDKLVTDKHLPPKVLIVHRFTRRMVPDAEEIRPTRNVQVVMHMDGWGPPWLKFDSFRDYIVNHPVEFTGFKLFYHNDTRKGDALLMPAELLRLRPSLSYIQYQ